jgi:nitrate reductase NapAB chaperone NapD
MQYRKETNTSHKDIQKTATPNHLNTIKNKITERQPIIIHEYKGKAIVIIHQKSHSKLIEDFIQANQFTLHTHNTKPNQ